MGLWVLEPKTKNGHHVPGTVFLDTTGEGDSQLNDGHGAAHLKRGTGKNAQLILVPQPSSDPNDPLNWPLWQRDLILALYCYCTICTIGGVGPILTSMTIPLIAQFNTTFEGVSLLTGYQLCTVGACAVFVSALARKFGKRPCSIASISCAFAGTLWGGFSQTYGSMVGARVLQGLGISMFESVTYAIIGDMYHVHQRGTRMTLYILAQSGISSLPAVVAGKISQDLGWRWVFYLLDIFMGIAWLLVVFFCWETQYNRSSVLDLDTSSQTDVMAFEEDTKTGEVQRAEVSSLGDRDGDDMSTEKKSGEIEHVEQNKLDRSISVTSSSNISGRRETVLQRMRPLHGTFTEDPVWSMMVRPFFVMLNPSVFWTMIIIAFTTVWFVITNFVIAQAFSGPPYLLDVAHQGYMSIGPIVGGLLGCIASGLVCDPFARYLTRRNHGVYEPEFRLPMMVFVPIVSTIGYFLFGNLIQQGQSPVAASVMFGLVFVSVQFAAVSTGAYIIDAFRDVSVEIFIISMSFKNFIFFAFTFILNDWFANWGPAKMFNTIAGVQLALSLTTIPVYIYGKRIRAWWHAHDVLSRAK